MAISVYGVVGTIDDNHWAKLMQEAGDGGAGMSVPAGLTAAAATGTRLITVNSGRSVQAGTWALMDATQTVTLAANTSSNPRLDVVCLQIDWAAATAAYNATAGELSAKAAAARAAAGSLVVVQGAPGTSPIIPALTQNPGTLWRTPLAIVKVASGVSQIATTAVTRCRPLPQPKVCRGEETIVKGEEKTITFPYFLFSEPPSVVIQHRIRPNPGEVTAPDLYVDTVTKDSFRFGFGQGTSNQVKAYWIACGD